VFSGPPQHGKTETVLHGLTKALQDNPTRRSAYVTFNLSRAAKAFGKVRGYLSRAGVVHRAANLTIFLPDGGQCVFTSIDKGLTGEPVDGVCVLDDYYSGRAEADSQRRREIVRDAYRDVIETRCHPGASIFVLATRWHPEDLSATLIAEGWEYINLPAIAENDNDPNGRQPGEALFPSMWSVDDLAKKRARVGDFTWWSLYQGRPRPKGGKVFHEPTFYSALPKTYRGAYGVDLAFSARTSADHSICLELWREDRDDKDPLYYVVNVDRAQVEAPEFTLTLKARQVKRPTWPMFWRCSGTEQGSASFIRKQGIPIKTKRPPGDKLVSATDAAAAWNDGRILVPDTEYFPEAEKWLHAFLGIVANFTGSGKEHDDDVDALGNAHAALGREADDGGGAATAPSSR
jgi:phage terminase large subunit-like protein